MRGQQTFIAFFHSECTSATYTREKLLYWNEINKNPGL